MKNRINIFACMLVCLALVLGFSGMVKGFVPDDKPRAKLKKSASDYFAEGILHEKAESYDSAIRSFGQVVKKFPDDYYAPVAQFHIGTCLKKTGKDKEAVKAYNALVIRWPDRFTLAKKALKAVEKIEREAGPSYKTRKLLEQMEEDVKSPDALKRAAVAEEIAEKKILWGDGLLVKLMYDKDNKVVLAAIEAAEALGDEKLIKHLAGLRRHKFREVAQRARKAISQIKRKDPIDCFELIMSNDERLRRIGENRLTLMEGSILTDIFIYRLKNDDECVRRHALLCLAYIKDERSLKPVTRLLKDKDEKIRLYAHFCLARHGKDEHVKPLLKTLANEEEPSLQSVAAVCLGYLDYTDGVPILIRDLDDERLVVRKLAIKALRHVSKKKMGYEPTAPREVRRRAIEDWAEWWEEEKFKKDRPVTPGPSKK